MGQLGQSYTAVLVFLIYLLKITRATQPPLNISVWARDRRWLAGPREKRGGGSGGDMGWGVGDRLYGGQTKREAFWNVLFAAFVLVPLEQTCPPRALLVHLH